MSAARGLSVNPVVVGRARYRSIKNADRIVVIEHGKITETGRHEELVARKGMYAALWAAQDSSSGAAKS